MPGYDLILIHPPALLDFRKEPLFPGALGRTPEIVQFTKVPIGMLSIADYLDRHGFATIIDNLGDRMVNEVGFDVEAHLQALSAPIFAVGLHFQQHSPGALAVASLCKQLHPHSLVIVGGLTATCFHREIIEKYPFIDAVVRAEAEKPLLQLLRAFERHGKLGDSPNLTYRTEAGAIRTTPLLPASRDLDDFEYTRFELLAPQTSIYADDSCHRWSLEVCRGCTYNCAICGGSAHTYKTRLGMERPAFRSPRRIVADIKNLNERGVRFVGLYQDPRMGGKGYWQELLATLKKEKPEIERLSLDLLIPADEEFIREVASIGREIILHLCPDTGSDQVRRALGRPYSNQALLHTMKLCHSYRIPVTNFFSVGLAEETVEEVGKTWELWAELDAMNEQARRQGAFGDIEGSVPIGGQILGPIVIDPGSPAFDDPQRYGYTLLYQNLEEYVAGLCQPTWKHWLNYQTKELDRESIVELINQSIEFTIDQRERHGFYSQAEAHYERCRVEADRVVQREIDTILEIADEKEKRARIVAIRKNLDQLEKTRMTFL